MTCQTVVLDANIAANCAGGISVVAVSAIGLDEFCQNIKNHYDGLKLEISRDRFSNILTLHKIVVQDKNQGQGTEIMGQICNYADQNGDILALTPDSVFGGNKNRLKGFYKRFGFVDNAGRNKDYGTREAMIRYPKN